MMSVIFTSPSKTLSITVKGLVKVKSNIVNGFTQFFLIDSEGTAPFELKGTNWEFEFSPDVGAFLKSGKEIIPHKELENVSN